jgi:hypothetical protein
VPAKHVVERIGIDADVPAITDRLPYISRTERSSQMVELCDNPNHVGDLLGVHDWQASDRPAIVLAGPKIFVVIVDGSFAHLEEARDHRAGDRRLIQDAQYDARAGALFAERRACHELGVLLQYPSQGIAEI